MFNIYYENPQSQIQSPIGIEVFSSPIEATHNNCSTYKFHVPTPVTDQNRPALYRYGIILTENDLNRLDSNEPSENSWLSDNVINYYMKLVSISIPYSMRQKFWLFTHLIFRIF